MFPYFYILLIRISEILLSISDYSLKFQSYFTHVTVKNVLSEISLIKIARSTSLIQI